jgi:hypothetical protein
VAVDSSGNFYIADTVNNVVRKVTAAGTSAPLRATARKAMEEMEVRPRPRN